MGRLKILPQVRNIIAANATKAHGFVQITGDFNNVIGQ